jgi:hypothetical protein
VRALAAQHFLFAERVLSVAGRRHFGQALARRSNACPKGRLTLVYAARDEVHNEPSCFARFSVTDSTRQTHQALFESKLQVAAILHIRTTLILEGALHARRRRTYPLPRLRKSS